MSRRSRNSPSWMSWHGLVYYGEVVGFLLVWVVGIAALVYTGAASHPQQPPVERVAAADLAR